MLSAANAVSQLERQITTRKYADISQTLAVRLIRFSSLLLPRVFLVLNELLLFTHRQAVKEVAAVFKPYTAVERIAIVWKRVQESQGQLRTMLDEDFDALYAIFPFLFFLHLKS